MKKNFLVAFGVLLSALFVSCGEEMNQHQLLIQHPNSGISILFADQTKDSVIFYTFDSYSIKSTSSWITVDGKGSADIKYDYTKNYRIYNSLTIEPNTENKSRVGYININSYEYQSACAFFQYGFLNIERPTAKVEKSFENTTLPETVSFTLADSAHVVQDSLVFYVQNDWRLEFADGADQSWVSMDKTEGVARFDYGKARKNVVNLTLQPNPTTTDRETKVKLYSGKVSNEIVIRQYGIKETAKTVE